jgi:hypothetical protein
MRKSDFHLLASVLGFLKAGNIEVSSYNKKSLVVSVQDSVIDLNFLDPTLFRTEGKKRIGLLDSLQETKSLGKALADKNITISFSRGSESVLRIGKQAKPSISRVITRSKEIQVMSVKGLRALDSELFKNQGN